MDVTHLASRTDLSTHRSKIRMVLRSAKRTHLRATESDPSIGSWITAPSEVPAHVRKCQTWANHEVKGERRTGLESPLGA